MAHRSRYPSRKFSPQKARKMLREGTAHGRPLTRKQRGMLGAAAGRRRKS